MGTGYGDELRRERLRRGLTQRGVAYQLGVCETTVQKWEAGGVIKPDIMPKVRAWLADPAYRHLAPSVKRYL